MPHPFTTLLYSFVYEKSIQNKNNFLKNKRPAVNYVTDMQPIFLPEYAEQVKFGLHVYV